MWCSVKEMAVVGLWCSVKWTAGVDLCSVKGKIGVDIWCSGWVSTVTVPSNSSMCCLSSDIHTEAVHAALAKYKERKMPMPSKRRSVLVQSSVEACTPPGKAHTACSAKYPQCTAHHTVLVMHDDRENESE